MLIALPILYTLVFLLIISKLSFFKNSGISFSILSVILIIKILSGFSLILIYKYYYGTNGSDIFNYFKDGQVIHSITNTSHLDFFKILTGIGNYSEELEPYLREETNYWYKTFNYNLLNDNRLIIRANAFLHLISNNNIYVHSSFFSFFSFIGLTAMYRVFIKFINNKYLIIITVYFIPSVIIWSSAMLKESVLMLALGLFLLSFFQLYYTKFTIQNIVIILVSIFLLVILKFYVIFSLMPGILFLIIYKYYSKKPMLIFVLIYSSLLLLFFNSQHFTSYNLTEIIYHKQQDFINMINEAQNVGSKINIHSLEPNFISFIKATPSALINSLLRPSIFDVSSVIIIPAVIENTLFILLFILSIIFFNKTKFNSNLPIIIFSISFIITLSILIGLTTPVLGAIVRYRIPILPFMLMVFLIYSNINLVNIKKILIK